MTGHAEAVLVVYDPDEIVFRQLLAAVLGIARPDPGHAAGQ